MPLRRNLLTVSSAVVLVAVLAIPGGASTQVRPGIPERACPRVRLDLEPLAGARSMGLRVTNVTPGDWPARLAADIGVEREVGGRWEPVSVAGLRLRDSCTTPATDCVTVPVGGSISIVPWTGMIGDAQCRCTRCAPAPAGRYRFVVTACDGCLPAPRTVSPEFDLAP